MSIRNGNLRAAPTTDAGKASELLTAADALRRARRMMSELAAGGHLSVRGPGWRYCETLLVEAPAIIEALEQAARRLSYELQ